MHILIFFTSTFDAVQRIQSAGLSTTDHVTTATSWPDVITSLNTTTPDWIIIERSALTQVDPTTQLSLLEPEQWPPITLVDVLDDLQQEIPLSRDLSHILSALYRIGDLHIDTRRKQIGIGKQWIHLPPLQYRLMLTLAQRAGEVVSYRELLKAVWGHDGRDSEARDLIKVHVCQIRRRLELINPDQHQYIRAVRGFGYMLVPPDED